MTPAKKILIAAMAVAVITPALAIGSAQAAGYDVYENATTYNFPSYDRLNIRVWPASHSRKVGEVRRNRTVHVRRCKIKRGSDWCKISSPWGTGWVNGRYLIKRGYNFARPHPSYN